ncbi:MAG TPA: NrtA/SsuA/CpmA family ABC transporter substrate-binding protein [Gaiellaceae bacterium]|nr:NrtA/SsuA/CpmA family ABC transporter substrate-binding protein [Gaiellaceae bacterium]
MGLRRNLLRRAVAVTVVAAVASAAGAGSTASGAPAGPAPQKITIAYQFGIGYAPLLIIKQQRLLEKAYPGLEVEWRQLASGTPITDGIIRGDIQIGAMGTGPMLVGWARGIDWKVIAPLDEADLWLMVRDRSIRTIGDLRGKRIATPTATSIQAVVLRRMAEVKLGNARALDSSLLNMDHPDGMQALLSGQIDAHFTSPPYQWLELGRGARALGKSYGYFGAHTFLVTVATRSFYNQYTAFSNRFYRLVKQQIDLINKKPRVAARILAREDATETTTEQFRRWITRKKSLTFTTRPRGLMRTAGFMNKIGLLNRVPRNWRELVFPPVYPTKGS